MQAASTVLCWPRVCSGIYCPSSPHLPSQFLGHYVFKGLHQNTPSDCIMQSVNSLWTLQYMASAFRWELGFFSFKKEFPGDLLEFYAHKFKFLADIRNGWWAETWVHPSPAPAVEDLSEESQRIPLCALFTSSFPASISTRTCQDKQLPVRITQRKAWDHLNASKSSPGLFVGFSRARCLVLAGHGRV